jgi:hypothetical protein
VHYTPLDVLRARHLKASGLAGAMVIFFILYPPK